MNEYKLSQERGKLALEKEREMRRTGGYLAQGTDDIWTRLSQPQDPSIVQPSVQHARTSHNLLPPSSAAAPYLNGANFSQSNTTPTPGVSGATARPVSGSTTSGRVVY